MNLPARDGHSGSRSLKNEVLSAVKSLGADVTASDINPEAVDLVRKKGVKAIQSALFENIGVFVFKLDS